MPLYNYRCRECETDFDVRQSFSEDPLTDCPTCHTEETVYRVIQPAGVVFKGSGFYVTDTKAARDSLMGNGSKDTSTETNGNDNTAAKKSAETKTGDTKASSTPPPTKSTDSASTSASPAN